MLTRLVLKLLTSSDWLTLASQSAEITISDSHTSHLLTNLEKENKLSLATLMKTRTTHIQGTYSPITA